MAIMVGGGSQKSASQVSVITAILAVVSNLQFMVQLSDNELCNSEGKWI